MKILIYPDKVLSQVAEAVFPSDVVGGIIEKMISTVKWYNGAGLAAPQIGIRKRIIVFGDRDRGFSVAVNPVITAAYGKIKTKEGCLSVPNIQREIRRYRVIEIWANDENNERVKYELKNMAAVVVQHELDHLNGITILDGVKKRKSSLRMRYNDESAGRSRWG